MAPAREAAGSAWLGRSTCFLGAAQEGCFFLLVKQINADIMHHQRFFYQCKQLLLPLALINNQLRDHLCFLARCFLPPHRGNQRRWLNFLSIIPVPWLELARAALVGRRLRSLCCGKVSQSAVLARGCPGRASGQVFSRVHHYS